MHDNNALCFKIFAYYFHQYNLLVYYSQMPARIPLYSTQITTDICTSPAAVLHTDYYRHKYITCRFTPHRLLQT